MMLYHVSSLKIDFSKYVNKQWTQKREKRNS
jgi:hypothetical protein